VSYSAEYVPIGLPRYDSGLVRVTALAVSIDRILASHWRQWSGCRCHIPHTPPPLRLKKP